MTEKELAKLKRPDLLALLVAQGREAGALQARLEDTDQKLTQAVQLDRRLKAKLDEKDEQLERLKEKLNEKDEQLERLKRRLNEKDRSIERLYAQVEEFTTGRYLEMESARSLSDVSFKLDLMLRAAQKVADRYLKEIQQLPAQGGGAKEGYIQAP